MYLHPVAAVSPPPAYSTFRFDSDWSVVTNNNLVLFKLKLRQVGNSLGIVPPREAVARLTSADPEFRRQMELTESILQRYRNAFKALAT